MANEYFYFPRRMGKTAFAMMEPRGQDWPATKEEESRMKQIDFSKPLRDSTGDTLTVVKEGVTLVRDTRGAQFVVDEWGDVQRTVQCAGRGTLTVENVPEPKREYLHLYQVVKQGEWWIDKNLGRGSQLYTKQEADDVSARNGLYGNNTVVVKVEV